MKESLSDNFENSEFEEWVKENPKYKYYTADAARHFFNKRFETKNLDIWGEKDSDKIIESERKYLDKQSKRANRPAKMSNVREQHIRLGLGFVKNPDRLKQNANKTMLNIFFRNSVWKNQHPKDVYNIHYNYFVKQRKLAACWAVETLADLFGVSEKTIRRWRDELVAEGSMTVVKRYNQPDIFIMGEVDEDGNEKYYADEIDKNVH